MSKLSMEISVEKLLVNIAIEYMESYGTNSLERKWFLEKLYRDIQLYLSGEYQKKEEKEEKDEL